MGARRARFVVLKHDGISDPHFDFMIEAGESLATWRAPRWTPVSGDYLTRLPDHRLAYLEYEGPVSGNRGQVSRVAAGTCDASLVDGMLQALLPGGIELTLVKDSPEQWLCVVARARA